MSTIVYQGKEGSYGCLTAHRSCHGSSMLGTPTFRAVFEAIADGRGEIGIVPIENTIAGSIYENYDLLEEFSLHIVGEAYTPIEHCLMGFPGSRLEKVYSHPKALEQCRQFFSAHPEIEAIACGDTASAAAEVAARQDARCAAIANAWSAELYGLSILRDDVQDHANNHTRFLMLAKDPFPMKSKQKCSCTFRLPHQPGALIQIFSFLEKQNITKIESRPLMGTSFEYIFYLDWEGAPQVWETIAKHVINGKLLGCYERN